MVVSLNQLRVTLPFPVGTISPFHQLSLKVQKSILLWSLQLNESHWSFPPLALDRPFLC